MPVNNNQRPPRNLKTFGGWLWRFLSSIKLAFVLIVILVGLSMLGIFVQQVPEVIISDPAQYQFWLENVAGPHTGAWTGLFAFLRLFDVFHSPWFLITGGLLIVSIVICSLNRWLRMSRGMAGGPIKQPEEFYLSGSNHVDFNNIPLSSSVAASVSSGLLKKYRYNVRTENFPGNVYFAADKNSYARLGTYLSHFSLIILILGFIIGGYFGFRDSSFIVTENSTKEVNHGTGLSLHLNSFVDEYWPEGLPKDYRSQVTIYEGGTEVASGIVRVNHPLSYKGTRFYQSFFGPAAGIRLRSADGLVVYDEAVALSGQVGAGSAQRPVGSFIIPEPSLNVYLIGPSSSDDPMLKSDQLAMQIYHRDSNSPASSQILTQGVPVTIEGLEFTFTGPSKFSGFQVSRDPGNPLIWIASILFLIGICLVFYFPYRRIWIFIQSRPVGSRLLAHSVSTRSLETEPEFSKFTSELKNNLNKNQNRETES